MLLRRCILLAAIFGIASPVLAQSLPDTNPLEGKDDLARVMVDGIHKYLDRELAASVEKRKQFWNVDRTSLEAFQKSIAPNRERLKKILGVVDQRLPARMEFVASVKQPALVAENKLYKVYAVRWPVLPGIDGEGLLLEPTTRPNSRPRNIIAIPDADSTPEMIVGLAPGLPASAQFARRAAETGDRVIVPTLIDRKDTWSGSANIKRWTNQPHREFVWRMSYEMGRHIIGYEVQKVLAATDWFHQQYGPTHVTTMGYGEGGLLALYSAAVDRRITGVVVSGYFAKRESLADEPIYRSVWGLLREFGDAEIAAMTTGPLVIEYADWPAVKGPPTPGNGRAGAAPGALVTPPFATAQSEFKLLDNLAPAAEFRYGGLQLQKSSEGVPFSSKAPFFQGPENAPPSTTKPMDLRKDFDPLSRQKRQFDQLVDYTQKLLPEAARKRQDFVWSKLDTSTLAGYEKSTQKLRAHFRDEIIGDLPKPTMPMNPRSRLIYDTPQFKGYEVVLDLYDDVICYGILLVPNDIKPGEKRPVVVCQHGLEGRPTDVCNPTKKTNYYNSFGADLARKGYIVFAPQNPYIFETHFRQLVRKGHPLKISLYSFIYRQHERILDFLATLPYVDATKIAFYGLSYGGKVAMRICALLERYCLSICSGDFNEWIWKNITLDWGGSYMFTREYDMYEFDLGNTFNYAEMAALIAPRPFMVERGHNDGVGLDEYVAFEYAKVRRLYAKLGIPGRTEIEFFQGGHEIHASGTYAFLQKHLGFPDAKGARAAAAK